MTSPRFKIKVIGCRVNQAEAGLFQEQFQSAGWTLAAEHEQADLYLVHTCTVTGRADRDSRKMLDRVRKENPQAAIAVSGCLAEVEPESFLNQPNVKAVISHCDRSRAAGLLADVLGWKPAPEDSSPVDSPGYFGLARRGPASSRSRIQIKIEDGCDGKCAYCRVRLARGKPVSMPLADVLTRIGMALDHGYQEIVLTGVNLGCWQPGLPQLMAAMADLNGDFRVRLSSLEPQHLSPELTRVMAALGNRFCPHLHLPIQSGDDAVLAAMRRPYTMSWLAQQIQNLRSAVPDVVLSGDILVGFPGESEDAFGHTCRMIQDFGLVRLHVFPFSPRPGTSAPNLPQHVPTAVAFKRARLLREINQHHTQEHLQRLRGKNVSVLLEKKKQSNTWLGVTEHLDRVMLLGEGERKKIVPGRVVSIAGDILVVEPAGSVTDTVR